MLISILLPDLRGGGAERVNLDLAHEFARKGHQIEFVLMQAQGEFINEASVSFSITDLNITRVRSLLLSLTRYLKNRQPDMLLAAMWPITVIAPIAARLAGCQCRVVVSEHGMLSAEYGDWGLLHRTMLKVSAAIGYRLAHHRVGVSSGLALDMAKLSWMRPSDFNVIHNPIPSCAYPVAIAMERAENMWGVSSGARIVTVGTMKSVKNHALLLRAFALLKRPDARLMIVGDGAERKSTLGFAKDLGIAERVIVTGFRNDPTPFYISADLFVLSSDLEGFGNVIVEAMGCGTAVVSTDCPSGPREILDNGNFGRLVPVGDAEAMAAAIEQSLDNPMPKELLKARAAEFKPAIAAAAYLKLMEPNSSVK